MADKIANFEDYVHRDDKEAAPSVEREKETAPEKEITPAPSAPVSQETMEIEIEDPYQFLNAEEREEYILQRQKELQAPEKKEEPERPVRRDEDRDSNRPRPERRDSDRPRRHERPAPKEEYPEDEDYDPEFDEEYSEGDEGYEDEGDEPGDRNILLLVRIASIITGIIILFFIGMVIKTKIFDRYLAPDPDEAPAAVAVKPAIPEGFTEKDDTVVVTGASSLNLRSGPDTSSVPVGQVPEGTELKRIAVADDGTWALIEVEGQQVYASMKYLKEK